MTINHTTYDKYDYKPTKLPSVTDFRNVYIFLFVHKPSCSSHVANSTNENVFLLNSILLNILIHDLIIIFLKSDFMYVGQSGRPIVLRGV